MQEQESYEPTRLLKIQVQTMTGRQFVVEATTRETIGHVKEIIDV